MRGKKPQKKNCVKRIGVFGVFLFVIAKGRADTHEQGGENLEKAGIILRSKQPVENWASGGLQGKKRNK